MRLRVMLAFCVACAVCASSAAWGKVVGREVEYRSGDTVLKGYLAEDTGVKGKRPGVLVVHEWWGLNDYARKRARMLGRAGVRRAGGRHVRRGQDCAASGRCREIFRRVDEEQTDRRSPVPGGA